MATAGGPDVQRDRGDGICVLYVSGVVSDQEAEAARAMKAKNGTGRAGQVVADIRAQMAGTLGDLEEREQKLAAGREALRQAEEAFNRKRGEIEDEFALRDGSLAQRAVDLERESRRIGVKGEDAKQQAQERYNEAARMATENAQLRQELEQLAAGQQAREEALQEREDALGLREAKLKGAIANFREAIQ